MASPLRWFRKHQQIMMVFFGVGLMAIFGLGSVFTMINPNDVGTSRENPVIATWKGGKITRDDLNGMQNRHFQMQRFIEGVVSYARTNSADPQSFRSVAPRIPDLRQGQEFDQQVVDRNNLERFILSEYAKKEGIVVSDGMVDDYLALLVGNEILTRDELQAINKQVNNTSQIDTIYSRLKIELAWMRVLEMRNAIPIVRPNRNFPASVNPTEAVELFERTARRVDCQVLALDVDPDSVSDSPSDSELREIYNEGKSELAGQPKMKPGFKVPNKVNVAYFEADMNVFVQNEMNKITDEQVKEEYDRLVKLGDNMVMEPITPNKTELPSGPGENGDSSSEGNEGQQGSDAVKKPETEKPETKKPETKKPETAKPEAKPPVEIPGADPAPASQGEPEKKPGETKEEESNEQSLNVIRARQTFVKLQEEAKQEEAKQEEAKQEEAKQEEAKQEEAKQEEANKKKPSRKKLSRKKLSRKKLSRKKLSRKKLSRKKLSRKKLSRKKLSKKKLSRKKLSKKKLSRKKLSRKKLSRKKLRRKKLSRKKLRRKKLRRKKLRRKKLRRKKPRRKKLRRKKLRRKKPSRKKLRKKRKTKLRKTKLRKAKLRKAKLSKKSQWMNCLLSRWKMILSPNFVSCH